MAEIGDGRRTRYSQDYRIIQALNEEWRQLVDSSRSAPSAADALPAAREVAGWAAEYPMFSGCSDLAEVLAKVGHTPDAALAALLECNSKGSELAGRVVLQAMLGKLVAMARRDSVATVDEYVTHLWCRIRTYPLRRRPGRIAANLALDTLKAVQADRPERRSKVTSTPVGDVAWLESVQLSAHRRESTDHSGLAELTASRVIRAATRLGLIDSGAARVLSAVYADGMSSREAADSLAMSPDMVRFRCSRSLRKLAGCAPQLAAVA